MPRFSLKAALALVTVIGSAVVGLLVLLGLATKDPQLSGAVGIIIGNAFAEAKLIISHYFPSTSGERPPPDNH